MIRENLPYELEKSLEAVLQHHGVDNPELTENLAKLLNWVRQNQEDQVRLHHVPRAPFLITLLDQMGIYDKDAHV